MDFADESFRRRNNTDILPLEIRRRVERAGRIDEAAGGIVVARQQVGQRCFMQMVCFDLFPGSAFTRYMCIDYRDVAGWIPIGLPPEEGAVSIKNGFLDQAVVRVKAFLCTRRTQRGTPADRQREER